MVSQQILAVYGNGMLLADVGGVGHLEPFRDPGARI